MILAETTVVIGFLKAPTPRVLQIIQDHQAAISGVTVAEVYAGARSAADFARYDLSLALFGSVPVAVDIWPRLGRNIAALGAKGVTVPFPDILIATLAIDLDLELWHHDHHFPLIQTVLPQLKLFQEPP
jgi:predicted nucleic acid-binding protein